MTVCAEERTGSRRRRERSRVEVVRLANMVNEGGVGGNVYSGDEKGRNCSMALVGVE